MGRPSKYSPELRERAIRMVFEHAAAHRSQWAAIRSVAEKIGCANEVLRRWVRQAERDAGHRPGMTTDERQRLKELERENVELKRLMRSCGKRQHISPRRSSTAERSDDPIH
jgi:transposase